MHIVHISTVHNSRDPRIREKQLATVVKQGWRATLVTGDREAVADDGVAIIYAAPGRRVHRLLRVLVTAPAAILLAMREDADIYHFHDPELLPWALLLHLKRKPVIYDIHEDYQTGLRQKVYLPRALRPLAGWAVSLLERGLGSCYKKIIAESYYRRRFPDSLPVLNYPIIDPEQMAAGFLSGSRNLLYTGNLTLDRGALQMARFIRQRPDYKLRVVGYVLASIAEKMQYELADEHSSVAFSEINNYIPHDHIRNVYYERRWLAGLALFPDTPHYRQKELTKFFEYMAAGLPVVASNFAEWRQFIEDQGVGLCVDPECPEEIGRALDWLHDNPKEARAMGERGRYLVTTRYNWNSQGEILCRFYQQLKK